MNDLSEEQQNILKNVVDGHNVIVDSCAGTGKTTLILSVAKALSHMKILQMTYNSMLRFEVKDRVKKSDVTNMKVHTFHSLAVRYYLPTSYTDTGVRYIILKDLPPIEKIPKIDVFVLDEAQDMTALYYQFTLKYIRDMLEGTDRKIQLFILGDYKQGLYEFLGSDIRFLTMAKEIWKDCIYLSCPIFEKCDLKTSYRITQQMADFINISMLGEKRLLAVKEGIPVCYII
jgi:superfamily I DNA/RNA helicase